MNIKEIKNFIIKLLKHILIIFKEFKKLPNVWLYIILSVVLTLVFLVFTFPYTALIRNELQLMGENIGRSASISKLNFSFIKGINIDNMTILLKDGSEITFQDANLNAGFIRAFLTKTVKGSLNISNVKFSKDKMVINFLAKSGFYLKFNSYSEFPANGTFNAEFSNTIANGITVSGFEIPPLHFTSITSDLNISNKKIGINDFKALGPDITGSMTGSLTMAKIFPQSQLNLNVVIESSSPFLENYKILLGQWIDESNKIQIGIKGSISNPRIEHSEQKRNNTSGRFDATEDRRNIINSREDDSSEEKNNINAAKRRNLPQPEPKTPANRKITTRRTIPNPLPSNYNSSQEEPYMPEDDEPDSE